jgi:hypothetical protein
MRMSAKDPFNRQAILVPRLAVAAFFAGLTFVSAFTKYVSSGCIAVARLIPGISPKHCTRRSPRERAFGECAAFPKLSFGSGPRRYNVRSGLSATARLAVEQPSVVSLPKGMRYVLWQQNLLLNCRQFGDYGSRDEVAWHVLVRRSAFEPWRGVKLPSL